MLSALVMQAASMPSYSSVVVSPGSGSFMSTAAVLQRSTSAVAPQHSSQQWTPALPYQLCDAYSMLMHDLRRVVGQRDAVA